MVEAVPASGQWRFDSDAFFPLDGAGFGNSFHAERQSPTSTFHLATNIACFEPR